MELLRGEVQGTSTATPDQLSPPPPPSSSPVAVVLEFLEQQRLGQYTEAFRRHGIDGDLLLEASDAVLNELGVVSALHKVKLKTKFKNFSSSKITTV